MSGPKRVLLVDDDKTLQGLLAELIQALVRDPARLPGEWRERFADMEPLRRVGDYVASLTDGGAWREHRAHVAAGR